MNTEDTPVEPKLYWGLIKITSENNTSVNRSYRSIQ